MKKIALGDLGEFWYGDYKEPFEQLEGAVPGHPVGVVLKADDGKLLCAFCGKTYERLASHVATHGLTARAYKAEVGLLQKSALVSERIRLGNTRTALRTRLGRREARPTQIRRLRLARSVERQAVPGNQTAEWQNKTGRCYSQVVAVAATIARDRGRVTFAALQKRGINEYVVRRLFGDLDGLRRVVGLSNGRPYRYTTSALTAVLRNLARDLGRTPSQSDLRRVGLPSHTTYAKRFGSWAEACRRAGLDPNLPVPDETLEAQVLVAYATLGNVRDVARLLHASTDRVSAVLERYGAPFVTSAVGLGRNSDDRKAWAGEMARHLAGEPTAA